MTIKKLNYQRTSPPYIPFDVMSLCLHPPGKYSTSAPLNSPSNSSDTPDSGTAFPSPGH